MFAFCTEGKNGITTLINISLCANIDLFFSPLSFVYFARDKVLFIVKFNYNDDIQ
jgi:hypothetical protein